MAADEAIEKWHAVKLKWQLMIHRKVTHYETKMAADGPT